MNDIMLIIKEISERAPQIIAQMISNIKTPPKSFSKPADCAFALSCLPCNSDGMNYTQYCQSNNSSGNYTQNPNSGIIAEIIIMLSLS